VKPPLGLVCAALFLLAVAALLPLALLLADSLVVDGRPSLAAYAAVWLDERRWTLLGASLAVGGLSALGATLLGLPIAFAVSRFEFPGRTAMRALYPLPLFLPPFLHAIAWTRHVDLAGPAGAVAIFAAAYFPFVALLAERALESIGEPLLDAARLHAGAGRTLRRIVLPLASPAIGTGALLAFLFSISDFSVPDYLSSVGQKFNVFATEVFSRWTRARSRAEAMAASLPVVALAGAALAAAWWLRARGRLATVGGEFRAVRRVRPRGAQWILVGAAAAVVLATALGPLAIFLEWAGGPESYRAAARLARSDILTSLGVAAAAATAMTLAAAPLAARAAHARRAAGRALEAAALVPLVFPGMTLAVGLIHLWNRPGAVFDAVYDSLAIVVIALAARLFAFPFEAERVAFEAIDPELDDAAAAHGARRWRRFARIGLALGGGGIVSGWILGFVFSMRELDTLAVLSQGYSTIPFRLYNLIHTGREGYVAALAVILIFLMTLPVALRALLAPSRSAARAPSRPRW
jgi:iron(III) transport system permease protein